MSHHPCHVLVGFVKTSLIWIAQTAVRQLLLCMTSMSAPQWLDLIRCGGALLLALLSLLGGCAQLPAVVARPPSFARQDVADTPLAAAAQRALAGAEPELSGVRLLTAGSDAFHVRMALVHDAEKTLDVQYYLIADDSSGRDFVAALAQAARRGVRVRVLLDDLNAAGQERMLDALAAQPNVEVRLFNPMPARVGGPALRVLLSLPEFGRVNRRMHNKLLIADNSWAVCGGRNIADPYFDRSAQGNFVDTDVVVAGAAVPALAAGFDAYWNSPAAFSRHSPATVPGSMHRSAAATTPTVDVSATLEAPRAGSVVSDLLQGRPGLLLPARVRAVADPPDKVIAPGVADAAAVGTAYLELLGSARSEVWIATPYLVPVAEVSDVLQSASARQVRVAVLTNSSATTDEPVVHIGYARHRRALLRMGVLVHELMPEVEGESASPSASRAGRLHAKLAVVDGRWVYIGSMNMDPRSMHSNTELGLLIDSTALAAEVQDLALRGRVAQSWNVELSDDGQLRWVDPRAGAAAPRREEPGLGWVARLRGAALSALIGDGLL